MGMQVRESVSYRRLDCAYAREAHVPMMEFLESQGMDTGLRYQIVKESFVGKHGLANPKTRRLVVLIEEERANDIILTMHEIASRYPIDLAEFDGYAD